jgi:hypothetical protein
MNWNNNTFKIGSQGECKEINPIENYLKLTKLISLIDDFQKYSILLEKSEKMGTRLQAC